MGIKASITNYARTQSDRDLLNDVILHAEDAIHEAHKLIEKLDGVR